MHGAFGGSGQYGAGSDFYFRPGYGDSGSRAGYGIQALSAAWILWFLTGKKAILRLKLSCMKPELRIKEITALGMSGFTMAITNCTVQVVCNATLQVYGGDLYVGIMTVIDSLREVAIMPVHGVTNSAQPVMGFDLPEPEVQKE